MQVRNLLVSFILFLIISNPVFAQNKIVISCTKNVNELSALFERNWEKNSRGYFSYVSESMTGTNFEGALHSVKTTLPHDKNPHLHLMTMKVSHVPHYGLWQVACLYGIQNPGMADEGDSILVMSHTESDDSQKCRKINESEAECG
jgi:hypothetical protein